MNFFHLIHQTLIQEKYTENFKYQNKINKKKILKFKTFFYNIKLTYLKFFVSIFSYPERKIRIRTVIIVLSYKTLIKW